MHAETDRRAALERCTVVTNRARTQVPVGLGRQVCGADSRMGSGASGFGWTDFPSSPVRVDSSTCAGSLGMSPAYFLIDETRFARRSPEYARPRERRGFLRAALDLEVGPLTQ